MTSSSAKRADAALLDTCKAIRALLAKASRDEIVSRYRVGVLLSHVLRTPRTYGEHAMDRLARELGIPSPTLYRYTQVAETWKESELRALASRTNRFGTALSWSHLTALTSVSDAAVRQALAEEALVHGWTVRKLTELTRAIVVENDDEEDNGVGAGQSARLALNEGVTVTLRAANDLEVFMTALESRADDLDHGADEELLVRAIAALERLHTRTETSLDQLRGMTRSSRTRIRLVAPVAAIDGPEPGEELEEEDVEEEPLGGTRHAYGNVRCS